MWKMSGTTLLDGGSQENAIDSRLLSESQLTKLEGPIPLTGATHPLSTSARGRCKLFIKVEDSAGIQRSHWQHFLVIDNLCADILLGDPWLVKIDPVISCSGHSWCYPEKKLKVEVVSTKKQIAKAFTESRCAVMILSPYLPEHQPQDQVSPQKANKTLPPGLADFADITSAEAAATPAAHSSSDHRIELKGDEIPPFGPIYPLAAKELEILREYLESSTIHGWIRPSTSEAGAPIFFVPKKGGKLRLCVDYRGLNAITKKDRTPIPLIHEILDRLSSAKIFTKLDLKDAYHRIRIREGDEWKTAFRTRYGHFEYLVMPFGLANAPATWQSHIEKVLKGLVDVICIVYMDDILIFSENPKDHEKHVRLVLQRLRDAKLYINLDKCNFNQDTVGYLGFIVGPEGIRMEEERVAAIANWCPPVSVKDIQVFLGFTGFYRRFIKNYAKIAAPLTDLLRGQPVHMFAMTTAAMRAFEELKNAFTIAPLLKHYDPNLPIRVETDASGRALGAVISQKHGDLWHPIAFLSRKLSPAEANYDTADAEFLAIVEAFRTWRHYLAYTQHPVLVVTDHLNLKYLETKKLRPRQIRWVQELAAFDFVIEWREGHRNPADPLSRRPDHFHNPSSIRSQSDDNPTKFPGQDNPKETLQDLDEVSVYEEACTHFIEKFRVAALRMVPATRSSLPLADPAPARRRGQGNVSPVPEDKCSPESSSVWGGNSICRSISLLPCVLQRPQNVCDPARVDERHRELLLPYVYYRQGETLPGGREQSTICEGGTVRAREPADGVWGCDSATGGAVGESSIAETAANCARVARLTEVARGRASEPAHELLLPPMLDHILSLQRRDAFVVSGQWRQRRSTRNPAEEHPFSVGPDGLLRYMRRVYVPPDPAVRRELMTLFHDGPMAGHLGQAKTYKRIAKYYYWDSLRKDVGKHVKYCAICQRTKARRHLPYGQLHPLPPPSQPWEEITLDFITDLPASPDISGKLCDSLLVVVDRFTKVTRFIPVNKTITADGLATVLLHYIFCVYGLPLGIVSDRSSLITSHFWATLSQLLNFKRRLSTANHPQTDGQTERLNQAIEHYMRVFCAYEQNDWADKVAMAEFVYNSAVHATLGISPYEALYGFQPRGPPDIEAALRPPIVPTAQDRVKTLKEERAKIPELLRQAQTWQKKWYDARHKPKEFKVGDRVLLSTKYLRQKRPARKFCDKYIGPFPIIRVSKSGLAYELDLPKKYRMHHTFPVSVLEEHHRLPGKSPSPEAPDLVEKDMYEVEAIIGHKGTHRRRWYKIRWKDYPPEEDTWVLKRNINAAELLKEYEDGLRARRTRM